MARTRTWSTTIPVDHTQIKNLPDSTRDLREDLEERVDGILAGFVNTGATNGLLLGRLLTVGTNNALTPGTGTAAAIDIYGKTTGSITECFIKDSSGNEVQITEQGRLKLGKLRNDEYMVGIGTGSGNVNILKINTAGVTQITNPVTFDSHPLAPNTNLSTDLQLAPKGYVDKHLGAWVDKSADYSTQQATTDGFVVAYSGGEADNKQTQLLGYTDSNATPTTIRTKAQWIDNFSATQPILNIMFPVKKNDYWKIIASNTTPTVYWISLGN